MYPTPKENSARIDEHVERNRRSTKSKHDDNLVDSRLLYSIVSD